MENQELDAIEQISHYPIPPDNGEADTRHVLTMLARDKTGTLARVIGLFSARNYNVDSLSADNIDVERGISCITITTRGTNKVIEQIKRQLERLIDIHCVIDVSNSKDRVIRELALIKIRAKGQARLEALTIANSFRAHVVDGADDTFIIEISGAPRKIRTLISLLKPLGLAGVVKTGTAGMINSSYSPFEEILKQEEKS